MVVSDVSTTPSVEENVGQDPSAQLSEAHQPSSYLFLCTQDWIELVSTSSQVSGSFWLVPLFLISFLHKSVTFVGGCT